MHEQARGHMVGLGGGGGVDSQTRGCTILALLWVQLIITIAGDIKVAYL